MMRTLLRWLGIASAAEVQALRNDVTAAYDRAAKSELACFALVGHLEQLRGRVEALARPNPPPDMPPAPNGATMAVEARNG